jgi:hypothetical protein
MRDPSGRMVRLFVVCFSFFAAVNLLLGGVRPIRLGFHYDFLLLYSGAFLGMLGAQFALHSIWCVLAPFPWPKRYLVAVLCGLVLFGSFAVGVGMPTGRTLLTNLLYLPLLAFAVQAPLWGMRVWFRWRMADCSDPDSARFEPFRIAHWLLATTFVALALAAARAADSISTSPDSDAMADLAQTSVLLIMLSAAAVLPMVQVGLHERRVLLDGAFALAGVGIVAAFVALGAISGGSRPVWQFSVVFSSFGVTYSAAVFTPLLIARRLGYRLLCSRRRTAS